MTTTQGPGRFTDELELSDVLNHSNFSNLSAIAQDLAIDAGKIPKRLCCPFCLFDFGFEFLLKSHIQDVHPHEVKLLSKSKSDAIKTDNCLYCGAKFYIHGLLPKHVIRKHQECILGLASNSSDAGENVNCNFCHYRVSSKQIKLLFIHLENKHLKNVDEMLSNFDAVVNERIKNQEYVQQNDENLPSKPASSDHTTSHTNPPYLKPILKRGSLKSDCGNLNETISTEVKQRKLRFNLPADSSFTSVSSDKENVPLRIIAKRTISLRIRKQKSRKPLPIVNQTETRNVLGDITDIVHDSLTSTLDPKFNHIIDLPFKCGLCEEKYSNNSILLRHVKKKHGKIHFHPAYRCGLCKAKFFRNSYLIKHNKLHDKPKRSSSFQYTPLQNEILST